MRNYGKNKNGKIQEHRNTHTLKKVVHNTRNKNNNKRLE